MPFRAGKIRWACGVEWGKDMTEKSVRVVLRTFVEERDWRKFHTQENLAKSIAIEAGELLECFQWGATPVSEHVLDELADVLTYCFLLADQLGIEPEKIILDKLARTQAKYPVEKSRSRNTKYDKL